MDFSWLSQIFDAILSFIPRLLIIRSTHGGVKWRYGKKIIEMRRGLHIIWPLVTDYEIVVIARQTHHVSKAQAIESQDGVGLAVSVLVVYSINNVVRAIGEKNWAVDSTVNDITESAVVHVINKYNYDYLRENLCTKIEEELTEVCKKELLKYGVLIQQVRFAGFTKTEMKMLLGVGSYIEAGLDE